MSDARAEPNLHLETTFAISRDGKKSLVVRIKQGGAGRRMEWEIPDERRKVAVESVGQSPAGEANFVLTIGSGQRHRVVSRNGALFEDGSDRPFQPKELEYFAIRLRELGLMPPGKDTSDGTATVRRFGDWMGCMADSMGFFGAAGGVIGGAVGGAAGAGSGAILGGAFGGGFGLSYCTLTELVG